jgi:hypothetical protein
MFGKNLEAKRERNQSRREKGPSNTKGRQRYPIS